MAAHSLPAPAAPRGTIVTVLAPTTRSAKALQRELAGGGSAPAEATTRLGRWLDRQVGAGPASEPLPASAWSLPQEPAEDDAAALRVAGTGWVAGDMRAVAALPRLRAALPDCRLLVLVESPISALADWVRDAAADPAGVERRLDGWRRAAQSLLDALPALREGLVLVPIDDAGDAGAADPLLAAVLRGWTVDDEADVLHGRLLAACEAAAGAAAPAPEAPARAGLVAVLRDVAAARQQLPADGTTLHDATVALRQAAALKRDNELLNTFLLQMQEELEHREQAPQQAPRQAATAPAAPLAYAAHPAAGLRTALGGEQLEAPHRHVDFSVRCARRDGAEIDVAGRLVEHHGKPGLLLFSDGGAQVLARWVESGDEGGRGFMLVIPEDNACAALVESAPAADWLLWLRIARSLQHALSSDVPMVQAAFWHRAAGRLADHLAQAPRHLRWDAATAAINDDGGGRRSVQLDIPALALGEQLGGPLLLRWRFDGHAATVELLHRPGAGRPWPVSWPVEPHGGVASTWTLPAGPGGAAGGKRAAWLAVSPGDRDWLLALLDALPRMSAQSTTTDGQAVTVSAAESAALAALAADARRHAVQPPWRALARRLAAAWRAR